MTFEFNYYTISLLIGGFTALLSGFVVYIHNRKRLENFAWLLSNITSAIWSFGYFAMITATTKEVASWSNIILHIASIYIPVCYFLAVTSITGTYEKYKRQIFVSAIVGFIFVFFVPTVWFVRDVIPKGPFNFVCDAGPLYIYYTIFFFSVVIYALCTVIKKLKTEIDPIQRARYKYIILFTIFGFAGGGSVFFLTFNVPILPYPIILFSLYPAVSGYAVFRYQLFNVKVIATELLVFAVWIAFFVRIFTTVNTLDRSVNTILLLCMIITGIFLINSVNKEVNLREKVEGLAKDLEKANMQQESLIHFITHQIKGFFTKSRDIYSMALEGDFGELPKALQPVMKEGLDSETKGVALVKEILDSANLKKGTIKYTKVPFDFKALVDSIVTDQKKVAEERGLTLDLSIAPGEYDIVGDKDQLQHVIRNIVDNSIKYTLQGGLQITLSQDDKTVLFTVKDTGVGITKEDRPQLFTAGGKGKNSIKVNVESTGFGLFIVKEIIEAHKGKIWVESDGEGKGSIFFVELPKK